MKWGRGSRRQQTDTFNRGHYRRSLAGALASRAAGLGLLIFLTMAPFSMAAPISPAATIISPTPLSAINSTSATFNWTTGSGVTLYRLYVGTTSRGNDIYGQDISAGTTSATVSGIPTGGAQLFVTLYSQINNAWQARDYTYTEAGAPNSMSLTPANATIRVSQAQPFTAVSGNGGIFALGRATGIASGAYHSCALMENDTVQCWGQNTNGQLGDGTNNNALSPVTVKGLSGVNAIASGTLFSCALLSDGTVQCWGDNQHGQLGNGTTTSSNAPVAVSGLSGVTSITAGGFDVCATIAGGTAKCWGDDDSGQLGNGQMVDSSTPVQVSGLSGTVTQLAAGQYHTCALMQDTTVECWGDDEYGQLGDGITLSDSPWVSLTPVQVVGLSNVQALGAGPYGACALVSGGTVQCWGSNQYGELGNGTITDSNLPVAVSGIGSAKTIAVGTFHACAAMNDGTEQCWGWNGTGGTGYGQLGNGTFTDSSTPVSVLYLNGVSAISANLYNSCAVLSDGSAHCWGNNSSSQLGNGGTLAAGYPTTVFSANGGQALPTTLSGNSGVWTSSNPGAATIDATSGVATGVAQGTTTITATYGTLVASTTLNVTQAPMFTSANTTTFKAGTAGSFTVTAVGPPAPTFTESGSLPSGITFDGSTGILSGTAAQGSAGSYPITFTASNGNNPNAAQSFTLIITQDAKITSPAPGSTLSGSSATFTWTTGTGATQYMLLVGTSSGAHDVAEISTGTVTSATVNNLPTNGATLFVTLLADVNYNWQSQYFTYIEAGTSIPAAMTSPAPGSTLLGNSATFSWTTGTGVTQYLLYVGTTPRAHDVYLMGPSTATSATATNIPMGGAPLYVTLFSYINGTWQPTAYTYTEAGTTTPAVMVNPTPGSTLTGSTVTFNWTTGAGPTQYLLYVGTTPRAHDVYYMAPSKATTATATNVPTTGGTLYVTLFSYYNGAWNPQAYTYTESH